jgi:hypothetical protein
MPARKPPFDPDSPGAQRLLRGVRAAAADQIDVIVAKGFFLDHDGTYGPIARGVGDRRALPRQLAEVLIANGIAERAVR